MIAAGLCLMGGCFAQDESACTVDTYWPAHSVHIADRTVMLKESDSDLTTPIWRDSGMLLGVQLENLTLDKDGAITKFGTWVAGHSDALYLAVNQNNVVGPCAYGACVGSEVYLTQAGTSPVEYLHVTAQNRSFSMYSPAGSKSATLRNLGTSGNSAFPIALWAGSREFDYVTQWWCDSVRGMYFMNQPMVSESHAEAIFTHGYNILTEL